MRSYNRNYTKFSAIVVRFCNKLLQYLKKFITETHLKKFITETHNYRTKFGIVTVI